MATSLRLSLAQMQDGTSLAGQDLDQAVTDIAQYTQGPMLAQRGRGSNRLVRTFTPAVGAAIPGPPFLRAKNYAVPSLQTPTDFFNEYRFHGYRVVDHNPTSTTANQQQFVLSTKIAFEEPAELTRVSLSLLIDSVRTATFLYGVGQVRPNNTWIDNIVISVEVQDPYQLDPGSGRYQVPVIVKRDFRVSGWSLLPPSSVAGVETTLPAWPGAGLSMPSGLCIEVDAPVSIPAGSRVTIAAMLPAGAAQGFGSNQPYADVETCMTVEWGTECQ